MLEEIYLYISSIMNMDGNGSSKAKPYAWPYILDTWHKLFFNLGLAILKGYCSLKSNFKDHITVKAQSTIFSCRFNWMYFQILDNFRILLLLLEIQQLRDNTKNALSSQCSKITIMKFKLTQLVLFVIEVIFHWHLILLPYFSSYYLLLTATSWS